MGWFSKKKRDDTVIKKIDKATLDKKIDRALYWSHEKDPTKLREEVEAANRQLDEAGLDPKSLMDLAMGNKPPDKPKISMEEMMENVKAGGLSYIASPPADFPAVAPAAHKLFFEGVMIGSLKGDHNLSLEKFTKALAITREKEHRPGEARLLYNIGLAHYKQGNFDTAISTLQEGRALTEGIGKDLGRASRKLQRYEEEVLLDNPDMEVFGTPHMEQQLLEMYLNALATIYDADSQEDKAAECRSAIKWLLRQEI